MDVCPAYRRDNSILPAFTPSLPSPLCVTVPTSGSASGREVEHTTELLPSSARTSGVAMMTSVSASRRVSFSRSGSKPARPHRLLTPTPLLLGCGSRTCHAPVLPIPGEASRAANGLIGLRVSTPILIAISKPTHRTRRPVCFTFLTACRRSPGFVVRCRSFFTILCSVSVLHGLSLHGYAHRRAVAGDHSHRCFDRTAFRSAHLTSRIASIIHIEPSRPYAVRLVHPYRASPPE